MLSYSLPIQFAKRPMQITTQDKPGSSFKRGNIVNAQASKLVMEVSLANLLTCASNDELAPWGDHWHITLQTGTSGRGWLQNARQWCKNGWHETPECRSEPPLMRWMQANEDGGYMALLLNLGTIGMRVFDQCASDALDMDTRFDKTFQCTS